MLKIVMKFFNPLILSTCACVSTLSIVLLAESVAYKIFYNVSQRNMPLDIHSALHDKPYSSTLQLEFRTWPNTIHSLLNSAVNLLENLNHIFPPHFKRVATLPCKCLCFHCQWRWHGHVL